MGNSQGKQFSKKEIFQKLTGVQRSYAEAWYCVVMDEETSMIRKTVFIEDVRKRFPSMPHRILNALFDCMDPDLKESVTDNAFFYLTYIILSGTFDERVKLTYSVLQKIGLNSEVTVSAVLQFYRSVFIAPEDGDNIDEREILRDFGFDANVSPSTLISFDTFDLYCENHRNSPINLWIQRFSKLVETSCQIRQQLTEEEGEGNAKLSQLFYTSRKSLIYCRLRDMSLSVLMEIYGILSRGSNQGYVSKTQWMSEMSKFFSHELMMT